MKDDAPLMCYLHGDTLIWEPGGLEATTLYGRWYCPRCQEEFIKFMDNQH